MASSAVTKILERLATAGKALGENELGAREALIDQSRSLIAALEIPSEFIQRSFWAEVRFGYLRQLSLFKISLIPCRSPQCLLFYV